MGELSRSIRAEVKNITPSPGSTVWEQLRRDDRTRLTQSFFCVCVVLQDFTAERPLLVRPESATS